MLNSLLSLNGVRDSQKPSEGDIYKILNLHGHIFEIRYGYYEDYERNNPFIEPIPIYPNFLDAPKYTEEGFPFVTKMQDACEHYQGEYEQEADCAECKYYSHCDELIGVCKCINNKLSRLSDNGVEQEEI